FAKGKTLILNIMSKTRQFRVGVPWSSPCNVLALMRNFCRVSDLPQPIQPFPRYTGREAATAVWGRTGGTGQWGLRGISRGYLEGYHDESSTFWTCGRLPVGSADLGGRSAVSERPAGL